MKRSLCALTLLAMLLGAAKTGAEPAERVSSVDDRDLLNVTVYNGSMSLIHDRRHVTLEAGINHLAWRDVSASIDATSALLEEIGGHDTSVLEQNFDYDLLDPTALLQKYVGRDVVVVHDPQFAGEKATRETARVLSAGNGIVLRYADRIETEVRGHIVFPTATGNFRDKPTLVLDLESRKGGAQTLDLSYMTGGLSWRADYVGAVSNDEKRLDLTGLVTLSNQSGIAYENARLQLVAGNVNAPPASAAGALKTIARVASEDEYAANRVSQENYFEYHLYTFSRPTSIQNNQTKQVTLLSAHSVPVTKTLELRGSPNYYQSAQADLGDRLPVGVYLSFENKNGDLGIPLPGGIVRLYKNDSHNLSQFMGADQIQHTPRNETVRLHLGDSFDVTAKKKQTAFHFAQENGCTTDSSYSIVLANAKSVPQEVLVVEQIPGDWQINEENVPHSKSSATTATWKVRVPADSKTTLNYTAHVSWCWHG